MLSKKKYFFFFCYFFTVIHIAFTQQPQLVLPVGHAVPVSDLCFSPDGKLIATNGGEEINVKIWEAQTGKLLRTIDAHSEKITSVSFSPDGKYIMTTGHDQYARIWDVKSGNLYHDIYYTFSNWIEKGFFSNDGKKILLVSDDAMEYHNAGEKKLIRPVYDTTSFAIYAGHRYRHRFTGYDMSADGKYAVTTNSDSSVKIWDLNTGKIIHKIKENNLVFASCLFDPSGKKVLACASDNTVRIWETASGKLLQSLRKKDFFSFFAAFSPDNDKVITCSFDSISRKCPVDLWDLKKSQALQSFNIPAGIATASVVFSNDGKLLLTMSSDGLVRLWETSTGKLLRVVTKMGQLFSEGKDMLTMENLGYVKAAFSKDSKYIVESSFNNIASVQETGTGKTVTKLEGFSTMSFRPRYSPDGKLLVTAGFKTNIRTDSRPEGVASIWDINTGKLISRFAGHTSSISDLKFSPDGKYLATASEDSTARLWDVGSGTLIHVFGKHEKPVYKCYFSADSKYCITQTFAGMARIWNVETGSQVAIVKHDSVTADKFGIYTVTPSKKGKYFKTVFYDDYQTLITETATGRTVMKFETQKDSSNYYIFGPDDKSLVFSRKDNVVITDIATGNILLTIPVKSKLNDLSVNEKRDILAVASMDSFVRLWEIPSGKLLAEFKSTKRPVFELDFSSDDKYFVTSNYDSIKVWELPNFHFINGYTLPKSDDEYFSFTLTRENKHYIVTRTFKSVMNIREIETGSLVTSALDKFNYSLTYVINPVKAQVVIDNHFSTDIYDIGASAPTLKIIPTANGEYLVIDSIGRYDGTEAARKLLYFTCGTEIIELEQVKDRLWVPDLAERTVNKETINTTGLAGLNICGLTPQVENREGGNSYYFKITPRRGGLGETVLYVNGIEAKRYKPAALKKNGDSYELLVIKEELNNFFIAGTENPVTIKAYTADNAVSSRGLIVNGDKKQDATAPVPNLYAVMVGVSDYKGEELDLKYAAKDATDISAAISNAAKKLLNTGGKEHVFTYNLTTAKEHYQLPEKNSIKKVFEEIGKKATANDILLIFFAGHGVMSARAGTDGTGLPGGQAGDKKQFYFLTADASKNSATDAVDEVGISTSELTEWMKPQNIKAQKRILIFDACNSGQAIRDFVQLGGSDQNYVAARNDDKTQQIKAIDKLNEKSGLFILSASASSQSAYEMGRYSQGLLTYSLLKAIKQQPDILEDGKYLNVSRWFNAAEKTVSDLAKESGARQEPQIVTNTNFNIGVVDEEVLAKIVLPQEKPLFAASNFQNSNEDAGGDDLELSKLVNFGLSEISGRGADTKIVYVTGTNSPDAYTVGGRYDIKGDSVTVRVSIRQNREVKQRFEVTGTKTKLNELATDIAAKAAGMVNK